MADYIGDTAVDVSKAELVVGMIQPKLRQSLQFLPTITDVSDRAVPGAKSISYPKIEGEFQVNKLPYPHDNDSVTTACEPQVLTMTEDELILDCHPNVVWAIPDTANLQSMVDLELTGLDHAVYAHGRDIDLCIWQSLFDEADVANNVSDTGDVYDNILCAKAALRKKNVPFEIGSIFYSLDPDAEKQIMGSTKYRITDASVYGNSTPLVRGEIGMLGGARLIVSNHANDATADADITGQMMWHKRAMVIGFQKAPNYETDRDIKCKVTEYSVDQFYGKKVLCGGAYISKVVL